MNKSAPAPTPATTEYPYRHATVTPPRRVADHWVTGGDGLCLWCAASGSGPACVFVPPGWGPSCDYALQSLQPLERRFQMIWFDARGTGRSQTPASAADFHWHAFVADLDAVREAHSAPQVWLCAHSWGVLHALHYALQHPGRVAGMILIGGAAAEDELRAAQTRAMLARRVNEPGMKAAVAAYWHEPRSAAELQARVTASMPAYFVDRQTATEFARMCDAAPLSWAAWRGRIVCQQPVDLTPRLHEITAQTLVLVGDEDAITPPPQSKQLAERVPRARLSLIPHAGHFPWIEQPEAFYSALTEGLETAAGFRNYSTGGGECRL